MATIELRPTDYHMFVELAKYDHIYLGVVRGFVIIQANVIDLARLGFDLG
jgi:hypothetical protein